jgi:hypothetical protein
VEKQHDSNKASTFSVSFYRTITNGAESCPGGDNLLCGDGTCISSKQSCPLVPACPREYPYRCGDGSCATRGPDWVCGNLTDAEAEEQGIVCCADTVSCTSGIRCEDGVCRESCLPYDGCGADKIECPGTPGRCFDHIDDCDVPQSVCADNCEAHIPVIPLQFYVGTDLVTKVPISFDSNGVPRTSIEIIPGTFDDITIFSVTPVSMADLTGDQAYPINLQEGAEPLTSLYYYSEVLLSTPFACSATESFQLPFVVHGAVDTTLYAVVETSSSSLEEEVDGVPCELQAEHIWYSSTSDLALCVGTMNISVGELNVTYDDYSLENNCENQLNFWPTGATESVENFIAWSSTQESENCICFENGCAQFTRYRDSITMLVYLDARAATECPAAAANDVLTISLIRVDGSVDVCATEEYDVDNSIIPSDDICLGTFDTVNEEWRCLLNKEERLANPTWDTDVGGLRW